MSKHKFCLGLCLCAVVMAFVAPVAADGPEREGVWDGVLFVKTGQVEVDLVLEIEESEGGLVGYLSVPTQDVDRRRLQSLDITDLPGGRRVVFTYADPSGDSTFTGYFTEEGDLVGDLAEAGNVYLCKFERRAEDEARQAPLVQDLSADGAELRAAFNAAADVPRLLMILSPTCHDCKVGARVIQRYLLAGDVETPFRVLVVWEPVQLYDHPKGARQAAGLLDRDSRVTHFWSKDQFAGRAFQALLDFHGPAAWDVFLLFPPGVTWHADPPRPVVAMNNRSHDPDERLDAPTLVEELQRIGSAQGQP